MNRFFFQARTWVPPHTRVGILWPALEKPRAVNKQENASRKPHTYNVGDKVLIKNDWSAKYRKVAFLGPYPITNVNDNGTVRVALNDMVTDVYNIRNVRPFRE